MDMATPSPELFWLTLTALMTALLWVPYILNRIGEIGLWPTLQNPTPGAHARAAWAIRFHAAHVNAVENLVIFAPLAIGVHVLGIGTALTATAAAAYFYARLAHVIVYAIGIPVLRTLAFFVGFIAQFILGLAILGML